nr:DUF5367 family protein [Bacillus subtilis]
MFSFLVWLGATLFFVLFGDAVLTDPAEEAFLPNFLLLGAGTALVLCLVFFLYQKLDQSQFAVIKLGIWGSAVGLLMDTISLWNHPLIFPALSKGQVIAFAIWMVCAYCMYLLIPLKLSHKK